MNSAGGAKVELWTQRLTVIQVSYDVWLVGAVELQFKHVILILRSESDRATIRDKRTFVYLSFWFSLSIAASIPTTSVRLYPLTQPSQIDAFHDFRLIVVFRPSGTRTQLQPP